MTRGSAGMTRGSGNDRREVKDDRRGKDGGTGMTRRTGGTTLFFRHSREGGNPDNMKMYSDMRHGPTSSLDPRLRGDDKRERE